MNVFEPFAAVECRRRHFTIDAPLAWHRYQTKGGRVIARRIISAWTGGASPSEGEVPHEARDHASLAITAQLQLMSKGSP